MALLIFFLLSCSEGTSDVCRIIINEQYPEIHDFILKEKITGLILDSCHRTNEFEKITFNGQTERKNNGHFYNDSCVIEDVKIQTFYFTDTTGSYNWTQEFLVYEFDSKKEKNKFGEYKISIERYMSRNKELHEFFESEDKWFMYYKGFP